MDDVALWKKRAGVGTVTMEGILGKDWNGCVKSNHRVHMSEWNASRNCQYAIFLLPDGTEFKYLGSTLQSNGCMHIIRECMDTGHGVNETRCEGRFGGPMRQ